jgi:hypothetical protein
MSRATAKKQVVSPPAPDVKGNWDLEVDRNLYPQLAARMESFEITAQVAGETRDLIFGNVKSPPPVTAYALDDGEVRADLITFAVSIDGTVYTFTGPLELTREGGKRVTVGTITPFSAKPGTEEGSWSAQAQG